jgi:xylulokinase
MAADLILAHDLGTTGNKATLFDAQGKVRASAFYGYGMQIPHPNWVEQDPEDWWRAVCDTTRRLLSEARVGPKEVACVTFSGQMMGCVALDRQARPLRSALIWADTRAQSETDAMLAKIGAEEAYLITGHRASSSYSAPKMMWVRDHQPEIYTQVHKFVLAKDFIVARLTGKFVSDYSDASGTNLLDLRTLDWSPRLIEAAGIPVELLPEPHIASDVVGEVLPAIAEEAGLAAGTPVVIGGGDGCCAAAGAGVVNEGSAFNYIGSSSWIALATREPIFDPAQRTFNWPHLMRGMYSPCGAMQAAGNSYQWLRDNVCREEREAAVGLKVSPYELMNLQAEGSPRGANGLVFFPYLLGERSPRWNADARGVYFGLSMAHTRADLIRATLEGITLNLRVILDAFREQGAHIPAMRVIGGGANGRLWRQIMADIYELPIQRPALLAEATSFGAALAGGIGVGNYKDWSLAEELTPIVDQTLPDPAAASGYHKLYDFFNQAYESFVPLYAAAKELA